MIDKLEALAALRSSGTMGRAAVVLRVTQSAVSKRVASLEAEVGRPLIERHGRLVKLTPEAERLLEQAQPLLASLRDVLHASARPDRAPLKIAATDSLLASWLPDVLRGALDRLPDVSVELHAHRGHMLLSRVRSGDYVLGLCPAVASDKELVARELVREPMVIVPARLSPLPTLDAVPVWAIEKQSLTWEAIERRMARARHSVGFAIEVRARLESFTALVQAARAGFAHALVPIGVARDLGVPLDRLVRLPGMERPISVVARKAAFERPAVRALLGEVTRLARAHVNGWLA